MFGWDPEKIVVENQLIGGGFGGKEDVTVQHLTALAAYKYQRPVKAKFTRQESLFFHPKRHAMEGTFTLGCDENGIFTGLDCEIYFDTGAYASLCGPVLERACTHSVGPYCYQNTDIRGFGYYTNNPPERSVDLEYVRVSSRQSPLLTFLQNRQASLRGRSDTVTRLSQERFFQTDRLLTVLLP